MASLGLTPERQIALRKGRSESMLNMMKSGYYGDVSKKLAWDISPGGLTHKMMMTLGPTMLSVKGQSDVAKFKAASDKDDLDRMIEYGSGIKLPSDLAEATGLPDYGMAVQLFGDATTAQNYISGMASTMAQGKGTDALIQRNMLDRLVAVMGMGVPQEQWDKMTQIDKMSFAAKGKGPYSEGQLTTMKQLRTQLGMALPEAPPTKEVGTTADYLAKGTPAPAGESDIDRIRRQAKERDIKYGRRKELGLDLGDVMATWPDYLAEGVGRMINPRGYGR